MAAEFFERISDRGKLHIWPLKHAMKKWVEYVAGDYILVNNENSKAQYVFDFVKEKYYYQRSI